MKPVQAAIIVGVGAGAVWLFTRPGGIGELFGRPEVPGYDNITAPGGFTQAQLDYYLGGFATHLTGAQAAQLGAGQGAAFAGATFGISIGVGALAGWLAVRNSNDTREDREVFANRLGFPGSGLGVHTDPTTAIDDKSKGLYSYLIYIGYANLTDYAMHVIGRKDFDRNTTWMVDVLQALWFAGFPFPK
jgi:hypothetical protein